MRHGCATEFTLNSLKKGQHPDNDALCDHVGWARNSKCAALYVSNIISIVKDSTQFILNSRPVKYCVITQYHEHLKAKIESLLSENNNYFNQSEEMNETILVIDNFQISTTDLKKKNT